MSMSRTSRRVRNTGFLAMEYLEISRRHSIKWSRFSTCWRLANEGTDIARTGEDPVFSRFWSIAVAIPVIPVLVARKVARDHVTLLRTLSRSSLDSNLESRYFVAVELGAKIRSTNVMYVIIMQ